MSWRNWSGRHVARGATLVQAYSDEDVQSLIRSSTGPIRAAGSGHSHAPLIPSDGLIIDTSALSGVIDTDAGTCRATVRAGTKIYAMGRPLHDAGLALFNQGDIDQQAISGATATGTHGTGQQLKNLSSAVTAMTLLTADGTELQVDAHTSADVLQAARLHLGAFGFVTHLTLQCRPSYVLKQEGGSEPFSAIQKDIAGRIQRHRHYEFFWYPQDDVAVWKSTDETDEAPVYPLAEEGSRCGWSFEVLPNHRPHKHTEMEYSVPAERGLDCFLEIRDLLHHQFPEVRWPVEYRTLAADDVWMSTAYERDTVTISIHQDVREDETAYYRAAEAIFLRYDGRPHWGKVHYLNGEQLAERHPRWSDWWRVRDRLDPDGRFLNPWLADLRPT